MPKYYKYKMIFCQSIRNIYLNTYKKLNKDTNYKIVTIKDDNFYVFLNFLFFYINNYVIEH